MKPLDLVGKVFGRLTVCAVGSPRGRKRRWLCECSCGAHVEVATANLTGGHTKSCGCMSREIASERATKRNTVHGHNRAGRGNQSPTWHSWSSMLNRCRNESHVSYRDYGGRGISVCDRWVSFANFLADMGERPVGKTLDREDVNGNYEPSNCRWATRSEQQRNRRGNVRGANNPSAKLTPQQVDSIRMDGRSARMLAGMYGVSERSIYYIRSGATWTGAR